MAAKETKPAYSPGLAGVIAGKSLYEGKFTIEEAHEVLDVGD